VPDVRIEVGRADRVYNALLESRRSNPVEKTLCESGVQVSYLLDARAAGMGNAKSRRAKSSAPPRRHPFPQLLLGRFCLLGPFRKDGLALFPGHLVSHSGDSPLNACFTASFLSVPGKRCCSCPRFLSDLGGLEPSGSVSQIANFCLLPAPYKVSAVGARHRCRRKSDSSTADVSCGARPARPDRHRVSCGARRPERVGRPRSSTPGL
jgi:hypothetical protein